MERRDFLKGVSSAGLMAMAGTAAAAETGDVAGDQVYFARETEDGLQVVPVSSEGGVGTETHEDNDCLIRCCTGDCPCPSGCHCLDPSC